MTIRMDQPKRFDLVGNRVMIAGIGTGFEATINYRVHEGHDEVTGSINVGGGTGEHAQFQVKANVGNAAFQLDRLFVEVFEVSAEDGSEIHKISKPVLLGSRMVEGDYIGYREHVVKQDETLSEDRPGALRHNRLRAPGARERAPDRRPRPDLPRSGDQSADRQRLSNGLPVATRSSCGPSVYRPLGASGLTNGTGASPQREARSEATTTRRPRMRAHTITTMSRRRRQRRRRALALALGVCALAIPATRERATRRRATTRRPTRQRRLERVEPGHGGSGYSSVNVDRPAASEPVGERERRLRLLVAERDHRTARRRRRRSSPARRAARTTGSTGSAPWSARGRAGARRARRRRAAHGPQAHARSRRPPSTS